jgi:hypothetical protein
MLTDSEHHQAVAAFFRAAKQADPELYEAVCEKYPVLSNAKIRRINRLESRVGLLGLQPANISVNVAGQFDYESVNIGESHNE